MVSYFCSFLIKQVGPSCLGREKVGPTYVNMSSDNVCILVLIKGLWIGLICGLACQTVALFLLTKLAKWNKLSA